MKKLYGPIKRIKLAKRDKDLTWLIPGHRSWDDPVWNWAIQIPLLFGLTIRVGKGGRT